MNSRAISVGGGKGRDIEIVLAIVQLIKNEGLREKGGRGRIVF